MSSAPDEPVCSCEWETALGNALREAVSLVKCNLLTGPETDRMIELRSLVLAWERGQQEAEANK